MKEQIEHYFTGELHATERIELLKQLETNPELREEFARYQNTQALLAFSDDIVALKESRQKYYTFLSRQRKQKNFRILRYAVGYAAAIALLIVSVHLYHIYQRSSHLQTVAETSLFVPAGQRINLTLHDGTTVWLNAQSRLTYPAVFTGNERRVSIEGEAYFEVTPDREKPFIVSASGIDVKVLGTSFNVYNYPQEAFRRISLVEGSLRVYDPLSESNGVMLKPNQEATIREGRINVTEIADSDYFLWKNGIYSFNSEELGVILKKLELYYDIEIVAKDPTMLQWRYTVKFRQRDGVDEIMRLLQKIHPFRIHKDEENNRIVIEK